MTMDDFNKGADAYRDGDYATAVREWQPLAEQGCALAQLNLGIMYANGKGVKQDYIQAEEWYKLAAKQGVAEAEFSLGAMYDYGEGVSKDGKKAAKWYTLAAERGLPKAQHNLGMMYYNGDSISEDNILAYMWLNLSLLNDNNESKNVVGLKDLVAKYMTPEQIAEAERLTQEWLAKNQK